MNLTNFCEILRKTMVILNLRDIKNWKISFFFKKEFFHEKKYFLKIYHNYSVVTDFHQIFFSLKKFLLKKKLFSKFLYPRFKMTMIIKFKVQNHPHY